MLDLRNLAAEAFQYKIRPATMNGSKDRSYQGYKIPQAWVASTTATYQIISNDGKTIVLRGTSKMYPLQFIEMSYDSTGTLVNMKAEGWENE